MNNREYMEYFIGKFPWSEYRTAPNLNDIKAGNQFSYDGKFVQYNLMGLIECDNFDDAEEFYQGIDNIAMVHGGLYEIALPLTECLTKFLPLCRIEAKYFMLDLLCMVSVGELSITESNFNNDSLVNDCVSCILSQKEFYQRDVLDNLDTDLVPLYCELILFCNDIDDIYAKESVATFERILARETNEIPKGILSAVRDATIMRD